MQIRLGSTNPLLAAQRAASATSSCIVVPQLFQPLRKWSKPKPLLPRNSGSMTT
jgi:hypothetical protein